MKHIHSPLKIAAMCVLTLFFYCASSSALVVKNVNLADMTHTAEYIFSGECTGRVLRYNHELDREVYDYTFRVDHMIKGAAQEAFTVTMSKMLVDLGQVPTFSPGEEYVVFLYGKSPKGFTSPVGAGQGKFLVQTARDCAKTVSNERNNHNLLKGMDKEGLKKRFMRTKHAQEIDKVLSHTSGAISHDTFVAVIESLL